MTEKIHKNISLVRLIKKSHYDLLLPIVMLWLVFFSKTFKLSSSAVRCFSLPLDLFSSFHHS